MTATILALITALVCALMPMDPALSRSAGSAFDPLTSIVTVLPGSRNARARIARVASRPVAGRRVSVARQIVARKIGTAIAPTPASSGRFGTGRPHALVAALTGLPGARAPPGG